MVSAQSHLHKRSISLDGHRTSVALEPMFWRAVEELAKARGVSMPKLVVSIDAERPPEQSLASAVRCAVLADWTGWEQAA